MPQNTKKKTRSPQQNWLNFPSLSKSTLICLLLLLANRIEKTMGNKNSDRHDLDLLQISNQQGSNFLTVDFVNKEGKEVTLTYMQQYYSNLYTAIANKEYYKAKEIIDFLIDDLEQTDVDLYFSKALILYKLKYSFEDQINVLITALQLYPNNERIIGRLLELYILDPNHPVPGYTKYGEQLMDITLKTDFGYSIRGKYLLVQSGPTEKDEYYNHFLMADGLRDLSKSFEMTPSQHIAQVLEGYQASYERLNKTPNVDFSVIASKEYLLRLNKESKHTFFAQNSTPLDPDILTRAVEAGFGMIMKDSRYNRAIFAVKRGGDEYEFYKATVEDYRLFLKKTKIEELKFADHPYTLAKLQSLPYRVTQVVTRNGTIIATNQSLSDELLPYDYENINNRLSSHNKLLYSLNALLSLTFLALLTSLFSWRRWFNYGSEIKGKQLWQKIEAKWIDHKTQQIGSQLTGLCQKIIAASFSQQKNCLILTISNLADSVDTNFKTDLWTSNNVGIVQLDKDRVKNLWYKMVIVKIFGEKHTSLKDNQVFIAIPYEIFELDELNDEKLRCYVQPTNFVLNGFEKKLAVYSTIKEKTAHFYQVLLEESFEYKHKSLKNSLDNFQNEVVKKEKELSTVLQKNIREFATQYNSAKDFCDESGTTIEKKAKKFVRLYDGFTQYQDMPKVRSLVSEILTLHDRVAQAKDIDAIDLARKDLNCLRKRLNDISWQPDINGFNKAYTEFTNAKEAADKKSSEKSQTPNFHFQKKMQVSKKEEESKKSAVPTQKPTKANQKVQKPVTITINERDKIRLKEEHELALQKTIDASIELASQLTAIKENIHFSEAKNQCDQMKELIIFSKKPNESHLHALCKLSPASLILLNLHIKEIAANGLLLALMRSAHGLATFLANYYPNPGCVRFLRGIRNKLMHCPSEILQKKELLIDYCSHFSELLGKLIQKLKTSGFNNLENFLNFNAPPFSLDIPVARAASNNTPNFIQQQLQLLSTFHIIAKYLLTSSQDRTSDAYIFAAGLLHQAMKGCIITIGQSLKDLHCNTPSNDDLSNYDFFFKGMCNFEHLVKDRNGDSRITIFEEIRNKAGHNFDEDDSPSEDIVTAPADQLVVYEIVPALRLYDIAHASSQYIESQPSSSKSLLNSTTPSSSFEKTMNPRSMAFMPANQIIMRQNIESEGKNPAAASELLFRG